MAPISTPVLLILAFSTITFAYRDPWLYCDTCLATINEISNLLMVTDKTQKISVSGFRIDQVEEKLPVKRSEIFLSELMDNVCGAMFMYGIFTNPDTQAKHVIRAETFQGITAPPTKRHTQSGPEIADGLMYACTAILEEHEDDIIQFFKHRDASEGDNIAQKFCVEHAKLCSSKDVDAQMWAAAEAAMLGIGNMDRPVWPEDPVMDDIEVEYVDLLEEGEAEEKILRAEEAKREEIRQRWEEKERQRIIEEREKYMEDLRLKAEADKEEQTEEQKQEL